MNEIYEAPIKNIKLLDGFWKQKQVMNETATIHSIYDRFLETGRFDAFKCTWKQGEPNKPHFFWDSDVAKWCEAVSYILLNGNNEFLLDKVEKIIDLIEENQGEDGYFNIYFTVVEPQNRYKDKMAHELYCAGHLIEAAIAFYYATDKDKFLKLMCRYADYIEKTFMYDKTPLFNTPGHPEIEYALIRLYETVGEKRYLKLAEFFINNRGTGDMQRGDKSIQDHLPVRQQLTAEGHAVRAVYLYSAMVKMFLNNKDNELINACKMLFNNINNKKMYITGGIGSTHVCESFTHDYDLPNTTSYSESCAAIGLAIFSHNMLFVENDSKYSDTIERIIYNNLLSSISLDGTSFFYTNPLEIRKELHKREKEYYPPMQRSKIFDCSCCPPNISRILASIQRFIYTASSDTLYIHQYISNQAIVQNAKISLISDFPNNGNINICISNSDYKHIAIRIPQWCTSYTIVFNGEIYTPKIKKGYAYFDVINNQTDIKIQFDMPVLFIKSNPKVSYNNNRVAVQRGPIVYCLEEYDNGELLNTIKIKSPSNAEIVFDKTFNTNIIKISAQRIKSISNLLYYDEEDTVCDFDARFIPYFAFGNRGISDMLVWVYKA